MEPDVQAHFATLEATQGRMVEQMARVQVEIMNLTEQIKRQNGRVTRNEESVNALRLVHAKEDGAANASQRYVAVVATIAALGSPLFTALLLKWIGV